MATMQWHGKMTNSNYQAWPNCLIFSEYTKMEYLITKSIVWILLWCASQHEILALHGIEKTYIVPNLLLTTF